MLGRTVLAACLTVVVPFGGCQRPHETAVDLDITPLKASDLGVEPLMLSETGERPAAKVASRGRFPAGLSIVRVAAVEDSFEGMRRVRPIDIPVDQAAHWNQLMDTLPAIREMSILRQYGFDPRGTVYQAFLDESRRIDCRLCLMFGWMAPEGATDDFHHDLTAVLWDAATSEPLATYRLPVIVDEELADACEDFDHRGEAMCAAQKRTAQQLRTLVRETLWDLVRLDEPAQTTQPSPWKDSNHLEPRDSELLRAFDRLYRPQRK